MSSTKLELVFEVLAKIGDASARSDNSKPGIVKTNRAKKEERRSPSRSKYARELEDGEDEAAKKELTKQ